MAAETVLSAFMQVLFEKLSTVVIVQFRAPRNVYSMLEHLSGTLFTLQSFLEDAEAKQLTDGSVKVWLAKLKDVAYDVDDLLDDYSAKVVQSKLKGHQLQNKVRVRSPSSLWYGYKLENRIFSIQERLNKIASERDVLGLQMLSGLSKPETIYRPQSSSLVDCSTVFGREGDRDEIVRLLSLDDGLNTSNVSVFTIVGMGGIGKTTLAQMVYHDERVRQHFEMRIWVYVSENFDERRLTKETLEAVACDQSFVTTNMNVLQEALSEMLRGRRYLLVLDDVWNEDHNKWLSYKAALVSGRNGSRIIVTTRNENVGRVMGGVSPYRLQQLSDDDCWRLFQSCAFVHGDSTPHPKLEGIGKEMVKKLKGLPLASKALGSLLYCKVDEEEWKEILRSEIWELPPDKNNILPALRLSYRHLPSHLKQCFAFCSVFPKDHTFEREKLIQIWVAQGFIRSQGNKRLEDIGNSYFNELSSRSFFQAYNDNYVMHDAMHDLAKSISADDCYQLLDQGKRNTNARVRPRHLLILCEDPRETQFEQLYAFRGLRALLLQGYRSSITRVPSVLFEKLKVLRVLDLHCSGIKVLPDSIGNLKQLRFLDLTSTQIRTLPSPVTKLVNLQTLRLPSCNLLKNLPDGMTNLINLRHLEASARLVSTIAGIGKLTSLQELEEFTVCVNEGYKITELKDMAELRGHLCIRGLNVITNSKEAHDARMNVKENLRDLHLIWEENEENNNLTNEDVLEGLQPHHELKELVIRNYKGAKFPAWVGSSSFSDLQMVRMYNCKSKVMPSLGQLPFLQYLDIGGAEEVTKLGPEFFGTGEVTGFPSLNELLLEDMPGLRDMSLETGGRLFPQLINLDLVNCPQLQKLPPLPLTLTRLRISETGLTSLPELQDPSLPSSLASLCINDCPNLITLREGLLACDLRSLRSLAIANCEALVSLPEECFRHLSSLRSLHIYNCPCLVPWRLERELLPASLEDLRLNSCSPLAKLLLNGVSYLPRLKQFEIADCPEVEDFPMDGLPCSLAFLKISDCDDLHLPPRLSQVTSLETLIICNCPEIMSFPEEGLPRGLDELHVKQCPSLKQRYREGGPDRNKLAHINNIMIDE